MKHPPCRVSLLLLVLLLVLLSVSPVLAAVPTVIGECVTVTRARQENPSLRGYTDEQLYAMGFCADRTTPAGGCSPGYTKYTTSAGHCCQTGYPYFRDGACHKCPEGYYVYDTSDGHCCKEGYPYYDSGTCYSQDPNGDDGDGTGGDDEFLIPFLVFGGVLTLIGGVAAAAGLARAGKPPSGDAEPPGKGSEKVPRRMHGLMQFGGDNPGRVITTGPGPIPGGFHGPGRSNPAYTAVPDPEGGEGRWGIPPSIPSVEGGHPEPGMGVVSQAPPVHPPVSALQISRVQDLVRLEWKPPGHDPSTEQLIGYEVFRQEPTSMSTALERVSLGTVDPGVHGVDIPFLEGAKYYNVRPIYRTQDGIVYGPGF